MSIVWLLNKTDYSSSRRVAILWRKILPNNRRLRDLDTLFDLLPNETLVKFMDNGN